MHHMMMTTGMGMDMHHGHMMDDDDMNMTMMMNSTGMMDHMHDHDHDMDMDHDGHDMDTHTGHGECPHMMYFHWSNEACILFEPWYTDTANALWLSALAIIIIALIREFVIYYSKYYEVSSKYHGNIPFWNHKARVRKVSNSKKNDGGGSAGTTTDDGTQGGGDDNDNDDDTTTLTLEFDIYLEKKVVKKENSYYDNGGYKDTWTFMHILIDSVLFTINVVVGYWLMLLFMTFNILICIAVITGFIIGRLIFLRKTRSLNAYIKHHTVKSLTRTSTYSVAQVEYGTQKAEDHCLLEV